MEITVQVGSVWADTSWRGHGRSVRVVAVDHGYAVVETLTNTLEIERQLNLQADGKYYGNVRDMRGSRTRIRLDRMRPGASGYQFMASSEQVTEKALADLLG
ncbi:hypothetical protein [Acrocarpospora catenulata]|uniref:hypothetical protein n=1 Tax=Acrocarpospora catenulata TaxID=2836182 RepID=UPI001BDA7DB7|nr:hypothetical protein [Acrocarpospora catenulata]